MSNKTTEKTSHETTSGFSGDRRSLLIGAGALSLGALVTAAASKSAFAAEHGGHHHVMDKQYAALIKAANECVQAGRTCINHCLDEFKAGDVSLADCARSVEELNAFCTAHAQLATLNSSYVRAMSELGIKICGDCEKECRKHEKKHAICKDCAEACAACVKECKAVVA
ncbi:MAG: four-helix bundle copper-binding protein [Mariprofundaceae bacterium]